MQDAQCGGMWCEEMNRLILTVQRLIRKNITAACDMNMTEDPKHRKPQAAYKYMNQPYGEEAYVQL